MRVVNGGLEPRAGGREARCECGPVVRDGAVRFDEDEQNISAGDARQI